MNDSNEEQPAINTGRTKSIEAIQATKAGKPGEP
jgi:transketolase